ncbi:hypothetical protein ACFOLK_03715 [Marinococcus halophilus]|uniref:hypothetical protein n=1 Tax=Marinococcus halophilus TaxID=1371 RepID=UPI00361A882E
MQTKIMSLVVGLVAFITISSFGVFAYLEYNDIEEELEDKALSTATYIASSPVVQGHTPPRTQARCFSQAMTIANDDLTVFFTRPISLGMMIVALLSFLVPIIRQKKTTSA